MIVVADTSPINYLIQLNSADLFRDIYGHVVIPLAVMEELSHSEAPSEVRTWISHLPQWVESRQVQHLDHTLAAELGAGEREAISLTLELKANLLLIDERAGRLEAEARSIAVAGTLAVLLQASLLGHFEFPAILLQLRRLGFRVSRAVETSMLLKYQQAVTEQP